MANNKDIAFVEFIFRETRDDKIGWEATAEPDQYVTSFKGKYSVTVDKYEPRDDNPYYEVKLIDGSARELLSLSSGEVPIVRELYNLAHRRSLRVDAVLDEIMGPSKSDEEPPF
jgi:hypothetical protein